MKLKDFSEKNQNLKLEKNQNLDQITTLVHKRDILQNDNLILAKELKEIKSLLFNLTNENSKLQNEIALSKTANAKSKIKRGEKIMLLFELDGMIFKFSKIKIK